MLEPSPTADPSRRAPWRRAALLALLPLTALTLACGNLTAGGARGEAAVVVSGDAESSEGASAARLASAEPAPAMASSPAVPVLGGGTGKARGSLRTTLRVFLESEGGDLVPLTDGDRSAEVDLRGETEAELSTAELDPGLYPRVRVVFTEIEATVESGLEIDGLPLQGKVRVGGEALDSLVVERNVDVEVPEGGRVEVLLDMNSTAWLNAASPALRTVAEAIFRERLEIRIR